MPTTTKPTISLVICAHNEEAYIGECLKTAIKSAGGRLLEILVIDNASQDQTKVMAEKFPEVKVIREEKKGLVRARECGYKNAAGEIIAYIDADTRMPVNWVDQAIKEFSADQKLVCLSGPYIYYDVPTWQQALIKIYWYLLAYPIYLIIGYMAVGGNFIIKKSTLDQMGGFDTSIEFYGEDTDIARRASQCGKVKFKPSFFIYSSGRRLANQGLIKTGWLYVTNFLSQVITHKPTTSKYTDWR